jgi:hypothetical protein
MLKSLSNRRQTAASSSDSKLSWYLPRWFQRPREWRAVQRELVNFKSLRRIFLITLIICLAIAILLKRFMPQIVFPIFPLMSGVLMISAMLGLQIAASIFVPFKIIISRNKIVYQRTQSAFVLKPDAICKIYLTFHSHDRVRMCICYSLKPGRRRSLLVAVPPTIDFDRLSELLPQPPIIRDARTRL